MGDKAYTREELDYELRRRKQCDPNPRDGVSRAELTTIAALRAELDATPDDDRVYRVFELALAERHAVTEPGQPFYRLVEPRSKRQHLGECRRLI